MPFIIDNDFVQVENPIGPRGAYLYVKASEFVANGTYLPLHRLRELADALTDMADAQEERIRRADLLAVLEAEAEGYSWQ